MLTSTSVLKAALNAIHYSGIDRALAPLTRGEGVIFTLHHVRPAAPRPFEPNRILSVTPAFLDQVVRQVIEAGFEVLSLDEVHERLTAAESPARPFAAFTFDDGYRDTLEHALPVFRRYGAPFAVYVPSDFIDGRGELWWLALEHVIREAPSVAVQMSGEMRTFQCRTAHEKASAFDTIYWWLRTLPEDRLRAVVRELADAVHLDLDHLCRSLVLTWPELRRLAADPLVTIGSHTRTHAAVARLPEREAFAEITTGTERLERELGRACNHFSFPYGDETSAGPRDFKLAELAGLKTAVTTRKGVIHRHHARSLTSLPRVSLNGDYQHSRYVKVFMSGAPFALLDALRRPGPATADAGGRPIR